MARLDIERQKDKEPERMTLALSHLNALGFIPHFVSDKEIRFFRLGNEIKYYPYSGWHTGKGINDGRGYKHLFKQLEGFEYVCKN